MGIKIRKFAKPLHEGGLMKHIKPVKTLALDNRQYITPDDDDETEIELPETPDKTVGYVDTDIDDSTIEGALKQDDINNSRIYSENQLNGIYNGIDEIYFYHTHKTTHAGLKHYDPSKVVNGMKGVHNTGIDGYMGVFKYRNTAKCFSLIPMDDYKTFDIHSYKTEDGDFYIVIGSYFSKPVMENYEVVTNTVDSVSWNHSEGAANSYPKYYIYNSFPIAPKTLDLKYFFNILSVIQAEYEDGHRLGKLRFSKDETLVEIDMHFTVNDENGSESYKNIYLVPTGVPFTENIVELKDQISQHKQERKQTVENKKSAKNAKMQKFIDDNKDNNAYSLYGAYKTSFGKELTQPIKNEDKPIVPNLLMDKNGNHIMVDVDDANGGTVKLKSVNFTDCYTEIYSNLGIKGKMNGNSSIDCYKFTIPNGLDHKEYKSVDLGYRYSEYEVEYNNDVYWVSKDMGIMMTEQPRWYMNKWQTIYTIEFTGLVDYDVNGNYVGVKKGVVLPGNEESLKNYITSIYNTDAMKSERHDKQGINQKITSSAKVTASVSSGIPNMLGGVIPPMVGKAEDYLSEIVHEFMDGLLIKLTDKRYKVFMNYINKYPKTVPYILPKIVQMYNCQYDITSIANYPLSGFHDDGDFFNSPVFKDDIDATTVNYKGDRLVQPLNPLEYENQVYETYVNKLFAYIPKVYDGYLKKDFNVYDYYITFKLNNQIGVFNMCYDIYEPNADKFDNFFLKFDNGKMQPKLMKMGVGIIPIKN